MAADEELGVAHADVTDEVQHAQAAGLEKVGMRLYHAAQLVAARMLEHADRHHFVELRMHFAKVRLAHVELIGEAALLILIAQPLDLLGGGVHAAYPHAEMLPCVQHEAAEAAADVHHRFAGLELNFAAHVLDLIALGFLHRRVPGFQ